MEFIQLLPYIAAFIIAVPFLVLLRQFIHLYAKLKEKKLQLLAIKSNSENKLQAFERMTLFLERIKPSNLVKQFDKNLKPHEFVFLVEKSISEEFEYNSAQQLYISKINWQNIVVAKNTIMQLMHKTYENLNENTDLEDYKTIFLMNYVNGEDYIAQTIDDLRKETLLIRN
ncbi:MAG: hypothetical protein Q4G16_08605 [Cruoricaptor ignavus]|nr:hypothetical protein [Cruoricaptor ignavus]